MTTSDACAKWMELSDREALGEPLSRHEFAELRAHEAGCADCAEEAAAYRSLSTGPLEAVPTDHQVAEILRATAMAPTEAAALPGRRSVARIGAVAAVVLAAAAAVVLLVKARETPPSAPVARLAATSANPRSLAKTDESGAPQAPLVRPSADREAEAWVASGAPSCRGVLDGVTVCLDAGSEAKTGQLAGTHAVLQLVRGRAVASLSPRPRGSSFAIATAAGSVRAVGTIFAVEIGADGATIARVLRGEVAVQAVGAAVSEELRAGQSLRVGAPGGVEAISAEQRRRDLTLLPGASAKGEGETSAEKAAPPHAADDPLARARQLRAKGQFSQAAEIYQSAYSASPKSSSGKAALLGLAELRLSDLGDAAGALKAFDAYLAGGDGSLAREAAYGRIRALHALGRREQEAAAIERFMQSYPNGPEAQALEQRLRTIRGR